MSQTNATAGVASSGSTVGPYRGRKTTGKQVLGKEEKLGELVYKFNKKEKADMYLRTTEGIANFVGVDYGRDSMRMLVKHGTAKTFTQPHLQTQFWHPAIAMSFCTHSSAICIQSYGKFMVQLWHIFA
jgi:hypothetical protein